jgi:hypothetical protein
MTALFLFWMSGHRTGILYRCGYCNYEITDVNFSFGVLERAVLFEDIQLGFYSN